jgi:hypothetical protein
LTVAQPSRCCRRRAWQHSQSNDYPCTTNTPRYEPRKHEFTLKDCVLDADHRRSMPIGSTGLYRRKLGFVVAELRQLRSPPHLVLGVVVDQMSLRSARAPSRLCSVSLVRGSQTGGGLLRGLRIATRLLSIGKQRGKRRKKTRAQQPTRLMHSSMIASNAGSDLRLRLCVSTAISWEPERETRTNSLQVVGRRFT